MKENTKKLIPEDVQQEEKNDNNDWTELYGSILRSVMFECDFSEG